MAEQVGSIEVEIKADPSKLKSGLKSASKSLEEFGKRATSVGRNLSLSVTAPLLLAGRQALRASNEFEMSMGKIQGLVGVAGDEVAKMGEQAKQMATETGQSAQAAGEALFFITSAGLRGADAMSVLEQSLKASTAGLGEAKTVADLATSALNAYGPANISATEATDVLTKSVREGKLETDQLAGAMGRVLPISSAMGVQFHEVGAAFAALSRTGTDANEAATQLRGILGGILNPTALAEKQLAALGSSSAELRKQIKDEGLLSTLNTLKDLFGNNTEAAAQVFGNVRALSGIMDLLGSNVDTTRQIFESLNDTVGATDDAFNVISETGAFKFEKAQKQLNNSMLTFGDSLKEALIPLVENFTKTITGLTESFNSLDDDTKKTIVQAGLLVAALGPVLMIIGQISIGLAALSGPIGLVIVALAGLTSAFLKFKQASQGGNESLTLLDGTIQNVRSAYIKLKDAQQDLNDITKDSSKYTKEQIENKKLEAKAALEVAKATLQEQKAKRQLIIDQLKQEIANGAQTAGFAGPLQILDFSFKKDKFDEFGNELRKLYEEEKALEEQTFALAEQMYDLDKALKNVESPDVTLAEQTYDFEKAIKNVESPDVTVDEQATQSVLKGTIENIRSAYTRLKDVQQQLNDINQDSSKYAKEQIDNKKLEARAALEVAKATLEEQKAKRQLVIDELKKEIEAGAKTAGFEDGLRKLYEEEKELERQTFALAEQLYYLDKALKNVESPEVAIDDEDSKSVTDLTSSYYDLDKALEGIDFPEVAVDDEANKTVTDLTSSYLELIDAFDEWNQRASTAGYTAPKEMPSKIAVDPGMDIDALADQEFEGFDIAEPIDGSAEALERFKQKMENTAALAQSAASSISQAFSAMGQSLFGDLQQSDNAFQRFVGNIGSGIVEIIGMLLANAVSNAILSGTQAGVATGPAAPFTTPMFIATAVGAVMSAFSSIPAFAEGGMVTGPTLAMVGDNPSGKEAIIPFEKMGAFMNMMGASDVSVNITSEFGAFSEAVVNGVKRAGEALGFLQSKSQAITPPSTEDANAILSSAAGGATGGEDASGPTIPPIADKVINEMDLIYKAMGTLPTVVETIGEGFKLSAQTATGAIGQIESAMRGLAGVPSKATSSSVPAFAQGGMVTGPTLAMVGDNASGKEAIIPFEKMSTFMNMMGGSNVNVNITGELQGDALRLVVDRSNKDNLNLR